MSRIPLIIRSLRRQYALELAEMTEEQQICSSWLDYAHRELNYKNLTAQEWAEAEALL